MENFFTRVLRGEAAMFEVAKGEMETTPARLVLEGKLGPGRK